MSPSFRSQSDDDIWMRTVRRLEMTATDEGKDGLVW